MESAEPSLKSYYKSNKNGIMELGVEFIGEYVLIVSDALALPRMHTHPIDYGFSLQFTPDF